MHFAYKTHLTAVLLAAVAIAAGCEDPHKSTQAASASVSAFPDAPPIPNMSATADPRLADVEDDYDPLLDEALGGGGSMAMPAPTPEPPAPEPGAKTPAPAPAEPAPNKPNPVVTPQPPVAQPTPTPAPAEPQQLDAPAAGSADEVAENLDKVFQPIQLFRARFDQSYTAKIHGTKKKSKGVLYVKKPGKLSLSYHEPNKNRAVSDGTTLKVYEHDNQQMFIRQVKNTEYPGAFSFILGKGLRQSFTFRFHNTSKWEGGPVLIGTPRTANPGYKQVLFYVDKDLLAKGDLGCIRRVLVIDAQGNRNRFDFVHAEEPAAIPDKWFDFEPPPNTEIVKG